jgi:hypothetical protein
MSQKPIFENGILILLLVMEIKEGKPKLNKQQ